MASICLCFLTVDASAFVHAWGKGNIAYGSEQLALTHLALLGWLLLRVSAVQHLGSDVHHAQAQVTGL